MGHMKFEHLKPYEDWFWEENNIQLVQEHIEEINFNSKSLQCISGHSISYDKLIIATGSKTSKYGWPGQDLEGVHGLYSLQDLLAIEKESKGLKKAVIVGGGLIGIELAEMFHSRNIHVDFLVREDSFWNIVLPKEESDMISRHIEEKGIHLSLATELKAIEGDGRGHCNAVTTNHGDKIDSTFVGITAGVRPNIDFLKDTSLEINRGILVNNHLETNIKDVYAIGDCAELRAPKPGRRSIEAVWYTGKMMGETVAHTICGSPYEYQPGIWFNSAKFFDIEYHVYGDVQAKMPDHHASLYWEHKKGRKSIRIIYGKTHQQVLGFNVMGIRFRHKVCEKWIQEKTHIDTVVEQLSLANFDPEFCNMYAKEINKKFSVQLGRSIKQQSKRSLDLVHTFINSNSNA